jgi:hypothetical protein
MDVPTSTGAKTFGDGDFAPDIGFTPDAMCWLVNQITAANTNRANHAEAGFAGVAFATRPGVPAGEVEFCAGVHAEQGVNPSNVGDLSDDQLFHVLPDDGTSTGRVQATFTEFTAGGLTANFSEAPASALKWPYFAIGPTSGNRRRRLLLTGAR